MKKKNENFLVAAVLSVIGVFIYWVSRNNENSLTISDLKTGDSVDYVVGENYGYAKEVEEGKPSFSGMYQFGLYKGNEGYATINLEKQVLVFDFGNNGGTPMTPRGYYEVPLKIFSSIKKSQPGGFIKKDLN